MALIISLLAHETAEIFPPYRLNVFALPVHMLESNLLLIVLQGGGL